MILKIVYKTFDPDIEVVIDEIQSPSEFKSKVVAHHEMSEFSHLKLDFRHIPPHTLFAHSIYVDPNLVFIRTEDTYTCTLA